MAFVDAQLRVQYPGPFYDLSLAFPEAEMLVWCNRSMEVLHITTPRQSELSGILREARRVFGARDIVRDSRSALTLTQVCGCLGHRSVTAIVEECGAWLVPPIEYGEGWEVLRIVAPNPNRLRRLVGEIRKVGRAEILAVRPREALDLIRGFSAVPQNPLSGLTTHQVRALVLAWERGLLDQPARERLERVARAEGLARSTFGEHLRKGLQRLVRNAYPVLKLEDAARAVEPPAREKLSTSEPLRMRTAPAR